MYDEGGTIGHPFSWEEGPYLKSGTSWIRVFPIFSLHKGENYKEYPKFKAFLTTKINRTSYEK